MKKLSEDLKRALRALASADAGEMLSGTDKSRVLRGAPLAPAQRQAAEMVQVSSNTRRREILLTLGQSLPAAVMQYAISACQRLHADLSVVCAETQAALKQLAPYEAELRKAGISWSTRILNGDVQQGLADYVRANPQIMFAVAASDEGLVDKAAASGANGYLRAAQWLLPLVVVAGSGGGEFAGEMGA